MVNLVKQAFDIGYLDTLSRADTAMQRFDPRVKLLTTVLFCGVVVSFDRYKIGPLLPLFVFPAFIGGVGRVPIIYILRKILWVSPFALMVAIFNPVFDTRPALHVNGFIISAGLLSFISIMLKFFLTVGATLCLLAVTGFYPLLQAADRLGAPRVLVVQLMFFFRYLFVLLDETARMLRARSLRTFGTARLGPSSFGPLTGRLLLRTLERAERIHRAMVARGFTGEIRLCKPLRTGPKDAAFIACWAAYFIAVRSFPITEQVGRFVVEHM